MATKEITEADILPPEDYAAIRKEKRAAMLEVKRNRRLAVGPDSTWYFESYETMWLQIHEMLFIEKGGPEQIPDELEAYNPLIPQGRELVVTIMFEITDPSRRKTILSALGGVAETCFLQIGDEEVLAVAEEDVDRTTADGKASSVQFVHFPMTDAQAAAFKTPGTRVVAGVKHPGYPHMTVVPEAVRAALADDLD